MQCVNSSKKLLAMLAALAMVTALVACNNNPTPVASSVPEPIAPAPDVTDAKRLSDGPSKLIDAMKRPTSKFHFSFKGQENLIEDKTKLPQVGPVALQADVSPEEINLIETRGSTTRTSKAKMGEEMNWDMANLTTLGVMTSPTFVIALDYWCW